MNKEQHDTEDPYAVVKKYRNDKKSFKFKIILLSVACVVAIFCYALINSSYKTVVITSSDKDGTTDKKKVIPPINTAIDEDIPSSSAEDEDEKSSSTKDGDIPSSSTKDEDKRSGGPNVSPNPQKTISLDVYLENLKKELRENNSLLHHLSSKGYYLREEDGSVMSWLPEIKKLQKESKMVNQMNDFGETALHCAARGHGMDANPMINQCYKEIVEYLLSIRADPNMKDNDGKKPYDLAPAPSSKNIVRQALKNVTKTKWNFLTYM